MSRRPRDPAAPFVRALLADAAAAGATARAVAIDSRHWSSATFTGAHHRVTLSGNRLSPWARALQADALRLPRQWLGELRVDRIEPDGVTITGLVLDDGQDGAGQPDQRM